MEDVYLITGLPSGTEKGMVRQLAELAAANPDSLPAQGDPKDGIPYFDEIAEVFADGSAYLTIIYTDRSIYFSGPGVVNTVSSRAGEETIQIPVWQREIHAGNEVWSLREESYRRPVLFLEYRGIVGVSVDQATSELLANHSRRRQFYSLNFILNDFTVGTTGQNQTFVTLEFKRSALIRAFPVGTLLNDVAIPEIGGLDQYRTRGPDLPDVGPSGPPVVEKLDATDLFQPWVSLSFSVGGIT